MKITLSISALLLLIYPFEITFCFDNFGVDENEGKNQKENKSSNNSDTKKDTDQQLSIPQITLYTTVDNVHIPIDPNQYIFESTPIENKYTLHDEVSCTLLKVAGETVWEHKCGPYLLSITITNDGLLTLNLGTKSVSMSKRGGRWVTEHESINIDSDSDSEYEPERYELEIESDDEDDERLEIEDDYEPEEQEKEEFQILFPKVTFYTTVDETNIPLGDSHYNFLLMNYGLKYTFGSEVKCTEIKCDGDTVWKHKKGKTPESVRYLFDKIFTLSFQDKILRIKNEDGLWVKEKPIRLKKEKEIEKEIPEITMYTKADDTLIPIDENSYRVFREPSRVRYQIRSKVVCNEVRVEGEVAWSHKRGKTPQSIIITHEGKLVLWFEDAILFLKKENNLWVVQRPEDEETRIKIVKPFEVEDELIPVDLDIKARDANDAYTFEKKNDTIIFTASEKHCFWKVRSRNQVIWIGKDTSEYSKSVMVSGIGSEDKNMTVFQMNKEYRSFYKFGRIVNWTEILPEKDYAPTNFEMGNLRAFGVNASGQRYLLDRREVVVKKRYDGNYHCRFKEQNCVEITHGSKSVWKIQDGENHPESFIYDAEKDLVVLKFEQKLTPCLLKQGKWICKEHYIPKDIQLIGIGKTGGKVIIGPSGYEVEYSSIGGLNYILNKQAKCVELRRGKNKIWKQNWKEETANSITVTEKDDIVVYSIYGYYIIRKTRDGWELDWESSLIKK